MTVVFEDISFKGTGVDPYPDRRAVGFSCLDHFIDFPLGTDVARVDPHSVGSRIQGAYCQFVVKVDIGDQWKLSVLSQGSKTVQGIFIWHGYPDDLATGGGKFPCLGQGSLDIGSGRVSHGLDRNGCRCAHGK
jgi:hypothetical protein